MDDTQGDASEDVNHVTEQQFLETYVATWCRYVDGCPRSISGYPTQQTCIESFFELPRFQVWASSRVSFDSAAATACLNALAPASCALGHEPQAAYLLCSTVFRGDAVAGDACNIEDECRADFTCDFSTGCPGKCKPLPEIEEPCESFRCATGLECGPRGVCVTPTRTGQRCTTSICEAGTHCDAGEGRTNTCLPDGVLAGTRLTGQSCQMTTECSLDDYCYPDLMLCKRKLSDGAPCLAIRDECVSGMHCSSTGDGKTRYPGVCTANVPIGGECDSAQFGIQCESGGRCDANICVITARLGEPCRTGKACHSGYCNAGVCATKPPCVNFN
jgi:hypothetical protein